MIVFYRNYKRTDRVFVALQSVKHFFPELEIRCLMIYDESESEYQEAIPFFEELGVKIYYHKKIYTYDRYGNGNPPLEEWQLKAIRKHNEEQAHLDNPLPHGGLFKYYTIEYLNVIYDIVKDENTKVLILDEDQFFTTGQTIKYLLENEFDFAYGNYYDKWMYEYNGEMINLHHVNGNIHAINTSTINDIFPLSYTESPMDGIESYLALHMLLKIKVSGRIALEIPTRHGLPQKEYDIDGVDAQKLSDITQVLDKCNIPYKLLPTRV